MNRQFGDKHLGGKVVRSLHPWDEFCSLNRRKLQEKNLALPVGSPIMQRDRHPATFHRCHGQHLTPFLITEATPGVMNDIRTIRGKRRGAGAASASPGGGARVSRCLRPPSLLLERNRAPAAQRGGAF